MSLRLTIPAETGVSSSRRSDSNPLMITSVISGMVSEPAPEDACWADVYNEWKKNTRYILFFIIIQSNVHKKTRSTLLREKHNSGIGEYLFPDVHYFFYHLNYFRNIRKVRCYQVGCIMHGSICTGNTLYGSIQVVERFFLYAICQL